MSLFELMLDILTTVGIQTSILIGLAVGAYFLMKRYINGVVEQIADLLTEIFQGGPVKHAMSVMGQKSGEQRRQKAVTDKIATQILDSPNLSGIKLLGKQIGLDIDEMIEEHGAVETMAAAQQIAGMLGIDITQFLTSGKVGLSNSVAGNTITNPYLGAK